MIHQRHGQTDGWTDGQTDDPQSQDRALHHSASRGKKKRAPKAHRQSVPSVLYDIRNRIPGQILQSTKDLKFRLEIFDILNAMV